jgi:hypothetical protein
MNISENRNNVLLKAISKIKYEKLRLLINRSLNSQEKEFLINMLRNFFWILEFRLVNINSPHYHFSYLNEKLNIEDVDEMELFSIANMNKIKSQIRSNFKFLHKIPRNVNFHFEINRSYILEENPKKKTKIKYFQFLIGQKKHTSANLKR